MYKKDKKNPVRRCVVASKFIFFTDDTEKRKISANLCTNIKCLDVHAKFYFKFS
jgi:hypothetical protein